MTESLTHRLWEVIANQFPHKQKSMIITMMKRGWKHPNKYYILVSWDLNEPLLSSHPEIETGIVSEYELSRNHGSSNKIQDVTGVLGLKVWVVRNNQPSHNLSVGIRLFSSYLSLPLSVPFVHLPPSPCFRNTNLGAGLLLSGTVPPWQAWDPMLDGQYPSRKTETLVFYMSMYTQFHPLKDF